MQGTIYLNHHVFARQIHVCFVKAVNHYFLLRIWEQFYDVLENLAVNLGTVKVYILANVLLLLYHRALQLIHYSFASWLQLLVNQSKFFSDVHHLECISLSLRV